MQDDLDRLRVTPDEVRAAMLAVQASVMSFDTFYALLEAGGWTRPVVTAAAEAHAFAAAIRTDNLRPDENDADDDDDDGDEE